MNHLKIVTKQSKPKHKASVFMPCDYFMVLFVVIHIGYFIDQLLKIPIRYIEYIPLAQLRLHTSYDLRLGNIYYVNGYFARVYSGPLLR